MRLLLISLASSRALLAPSSRRLARRPSSLLSAATMGGAALHEPATREAQYAGNLAKYLVDLHDEKATFDFCGGMLFQLVLSDALRAHLAAAADQPVVFDATTSRMSLCAGYEKSAAADNAKLFHGREVRNVPNAAGGMNFVLHLSLANGDDAEGWSKEEIDGYDGWGHDSSRVWRKGETLEKEGWKDFRSKFGPSAFTLHHRFYWHLDNTNQLWLSAEDGCEGRLFKAGN